MAFTGTKSREIIAEEIFKEQQAITAAAPSGSQQKKVGSGDWVEELEAALRNAIIIRAIWTKGSEYWHRADAICVVLEHALQRTGTGSSTEKIRDRDDNALSQQEKI